MTVNTGEEQEYIFCSFKSSKQNKWAKNWGNGLSRIVTDNETRKEIEKKHVKAGVKVYDINNNSGVSNKNGLI